MNRKFTDRSRILAFQRCNRRRYWEYEYDGLGIVAKKTALPLVVGGSVHSGLAILLRECSRYLASDKEAFCGGLADTVNQRSIEELAVAAALTEFRARTGEGGLELDLSEQAAQTAAFTDLEAQLRGTLNLPDDELSTRVLDAKGKADQYLAREQEALVEALVRAYARRRLRPLLEQYEVLEVEREGQWLLVRDDDWCIDCVHTKKYHAPGGACLMTECDCLEYKGTCTEIMFASRPDALLRDRESNALYILSYKTAATWDIRKERDAERDMQGLSEGVEVEKRLGELWAALKGNHTIDFGQTTQEMCVWLKTLDSPPRILGIRYEYILKSERWEDKDLSRELGITVRVQKSHLIRAYLNPGMVESDAQWNWSYSYHKEDGSTSKLYYKTWRPAPIWEHMSIKKWIDLLDSHVMTVGEENRELGYSGPGQFSGYTSEHPLDIVFHPPLIVYRRDDSLRDWLEQIEAQERRVAESVEIVRAATEVDEKRHLLNVYFPFSLQSCEYPTTCPFVHVCHGPEHAQEDPMGTGRYKVRQPNHPIEAQNG